MNQQSLFGKIAILLSVITTGLLIASPVSAQQASKKQVCLIAEHCWKEPNSCSAAHKGDGHMAKLTLKDDFQPIPGLSMVVSVCIATANDDWVCTTGNKATDLEWYGLNPKHLNANKQPYLTNFEVLQQFYHYEFNGLWKADGTTAVANPQPWDGPYEWGDALLPGAAHQWQLLFNYDPNQFKVGEGFGQKLATFEFEAKDKKCTQISWDPYGRIFDAGTLEPVPNVWVTLLHKQEQPAPAPAKWIVDTFHGAIFNPPPPTLADGNFSFVVPDGDYKLQLATPFTIATSMSQVDTNYKKAYSDIYPAETGEEIHQRGAIQHRDIPIVTQNINTGIKFMESTSQVDQSGLLTLQGRVSHPLARLLVHTDKIASGGAKTAYRTLTPEHYADKLGKYEIDIDQSKLEIKDDYIEVFSYLEAQKVDLKLNTTGSLNKSVWDKIASTLMNLLQPVVHAQAKSAVSSFEPILQFLDGYAYDAAGKPIPNAKVEVILNMSSVAYTQTTADATGHFAFNPEDLPNFAYHLKFTSSTGQVVQATTSTFLGQNQKYIAENKMNPYVANTPANMVALTKANIPTLAPSNGTGGSKSSLGGNGGGRTGAGGSGKGAGNTSSTGVTPGGSVSSPILLVVLLLVVLIGGVGAGIVLYMKNKQPVAPPPQW